MEYWSHSKLLKAVMSGKIETVERLLDNELKGKKDIINDLGETGYGPSPLMFACRQDDGQDMITFLLSRGAEVNVQDRQGYTALMIAVEEGITENVECLLKLKEKYGLQLDLQREDGCSALAIACNNSNVELVKLLVENGADINIEQDYNGYILSPLAIAIQKKHLKLIKFLHSKGAKVINDPPYGVVETEFLRELVRIGIDISKLSEKEESMLLLLTKLQETDLIKQHLEKCDCDIDEPDLDGKYPIWEAIWQKNYDIFELLWIKGANLSKRPPSRRSALETLKIKDVLLVNFLQRAAENKVYKLVEFLLSCGANAMTVCKNTGKSALEILKTDATSIMEMIDSGSETDYFNLKQLIMPHPEIMESEVDKLIGHEMPVDSEPEQMDTSDIEELCTISNDDKLESDQSSARKREREGSASEVDVPAKKSREKLYKESFKARITKALHSNEKINRKHAHSVFLGPTGSGKTSLMDRLVDGKLKPIFYSSTDIAEEVAVIETNVDANPSTFCAVDVVSANAWQRSDLQKSLIRQVNEGVHAVHMQQEMNVQPRTPEANPPAGMAKPGKSLTTTTRKATPPSSSLVNMSDSEEMMAIAELAIPSPTSVPIDDDIQKLIDTVLNQSGIVEFEDLKRKFFLYMRDAGGQVEFQETVSLLVFGPSIFFFVFRADLDFKKRFTVKYRKSASETLNCYKSSITLEESLLQSLASVYAMDTANAGVKSHKPHVFIVATHKDKLGPSAKEKIAELDEHLSLLLENSNFGDLVYYADRSKGQIMFAVDNTSASDDDFKVIRSRIHSLVCRSEEFSIKYPVSYLLFCLELQHDKRSVLTLEECRVMARKYGIVGDQVLDLLRFLHLRIGVIQFIEVEGVRPFIMTQPQILFKAVTDMIVSSFSSESLNYQQALDITKKGILTASAFQNIIPSSMDQISLDEFLKILVHLHIITPFPTHADEQGDQEGRYFIPCVLNHVPKSPEEDLETDILPLAVKFKCNHFPRGLFSVLITHLMNPEGGEVSNFSLTLIQEKLYKDQVSFEVKTPGAVDQILLKVDSSYLYINFYPDYAEDRDPSVPSTCCEVRQRLENAIQSSLINLHYDKDRVGPMVCFVCNKCSMLHAVKKPHQRYTYHCQKSRETIPIPNEGRCWFEQVSSHLRGVEVLQEKTLKVTCLAQSFHWEECGMKLKIPEKALHAHIKSCTLTIKASLCGQYKFPDDSKLVSPVFWVSCEPHCSFARPLSLEIEHWAPTENSDNLFMARALCSQKNLPYIFEALQGVFNLHSTYGVIELNKFSGLSVVQKGSNQYRCWADVFYITQSPSDSDIHFVITHHQKMYITKVKEYYSSRRAKPGDLNQTLTFKEDKMTLNVPRNGITIDGWKLFPAKPPIIRKEVVDRHRPSDPTVPNCVLKAKWIGSGDGQPMRPLLHTVDIQGATQEEYFLIDIPVVSENFLSLTQRQLEFSGVHLLTHQDHAQVVGYVKQLSMKDMIAVGVQLGLSYTNLQDTSDHNMIVQAWLRRDDDVMKQSGDPSWESLCKALIARGHSGIANKIMEKN